MRCPAAFFSKTSSSRSEERRLTTVWEQCLLKTETDILTLMGIQVRQKLEGGGIYVMQSVEDGVVQIKHKGDEIAEEIETVGVAKTIEHEKQEIVHVIEEKERETERLVRDKTAEVVEAVKGWGIIGAFGAEADSAEADSAADACGPSVGGDRSAGEGLGVARVEAWLASIETTQGTREEMGSGRVTVWLPGVQLERCG